MTQPATVLALAAALLAAVIAALLLRRRAALRALGERLDLERRLATADQRCRLIPELEGAMQQRDLAIARLREEKSAIERAQAAGGETIRGLAAAETELRQRLAAAEAHADAARTTTAGLAAQLATAAATIEQERRAAAEKIALLTEAREAMRTEFKLLAEEAMQRQGEVFGRQNREQIDTILGPMREKLVEFQQGLQAAHGESTRDRAQLGEQIRQLSDHSARMTTETLNLTRALKGNTQTQGAWGEMVLASILERSGLREGEEYVAQKSHAGEDGQRLRPDVVVSLPGGQKIVIDSKVSLVAFEAHVNAETDAARATYLALHLTSLRTHIRELSEKAYAVAAGSKLDYVIMFVPIEGALAAALGADPDLTALATERNVAIATPTTLMMALRTVANVWNVEKRHRNAEKIAERAGQLYDKFAGFAEDLGRLGKALDGAGGAYRDAMAKLSSGKGNLVRQAEQLRELGARTAKQLPASLLDDEVGRYEPAGALTPPLARSLGESLPPPPGSERGPG